jgi:hypothetical protein
MSLNNICHTCHSFILVILVIVANYAIYDNNDKGANMFFLIRPFKDARRRFYLLMSGCWCVCFVILAGVLSYLIGVKNLLPIPASMTKVISVFQHSVSTSTTNMASIFCVSALFTRLCNSFILCRGRFWQQKGTILK